MSRLLSLPREIRDKIFGYAARTRTRHLYFCTDQRVHPKSLPQDSTRRRVHMAIPKTLNDLYCRNYFWETAYFCSCLYHEWKEHDASAPTKNDLSIRGVCEQIEAETKDFMWRENFITFCCGKLPSEGSFPTELRCKIQKLQFSLFMLPQIWCQEPENRFLDKTDVLSGCDDVRAIQLRIDDRDFYHRQQDPWWWAEGSENLHLLEQLMASLRQFNIRVVEEHRKNWLAKGVVKVQPLQRSIHLFVNEISHGTIYPFEKSLWSLVITLNLAFGAEFWIDEKLVCVDGVLIE